MNSAVLFSIVLILFYLAYRFYAGKLERLWDVDEKKKTPAITQYDGIDYLPAKNWLMLFGHHFSSIAGAGPILGPIIACVLFGWAPAVIWIVLGAILIGGVHDFSSIMASIRMKGKSIGDIADYAISHRAKIIFSSFIWFSLILVIAAFTSAAAETFIANPEVVVPCFGLILVAIFVGILIYKFETNMVISTSIGLSLLVLLIYLGNHFPISIESRNFWIIVLLIYSYIASIIPVNILLQPRDYLSSYILFFGLGIGVIGVFIGHPTFNAPAFTSFTAEGVWLGYKGSVWPMLCVIVACGAISGFHSLVGSGTTSKQIVNETHAKRIGYGSMLLEGVVGILVIIAVGAGLEWNTYSEMIATEGWIPTFGAGYGAITEQIMGGFGAIFGVFMINAFILTSLDSSARIGRYISEELLPTSNKYLTTLLVVGAGGIFAFAGYKYIWPIFGAANQLVAAFTLLTISSYLLLNKKPNAYTFYPGLFMIITTVSALIYEIIVSALDLKFYLTIVASILLVLTAFMILEVYRRNKKLSSFK